ncbi:MAG: AAA family ATPase [Acidimicrobiales bacterium]|nr:AAA family ATPase [Acidimicrobiales bacterium]
MKLISARVQNYRSVRDTGWFDIEVGKTILVGPNEAGKTAVLEALQRIHPPAGVRGFDALRDYPRKLYNTDIQSARLDPTRIPVVSVKFALEEGDRADLPSGFEDVVYCRTVYLGNNTADSFEGAPPLEVFTEVVRKDLLRLAAHVDTQSASGRAEADPPPSAALDAVVDRWVVGSTTIIGDRAEALRAWLDAVAPYVDDSDAAMDDRHTHLLELTRISADRETAAKALGARVPMFVYFNNYFRVRPNLHLDHFARRIEQSLLDDERYDFGYLCLLKLLGFTARELADLGNATVSSDDPAAFETYRSQLDERSIKLNAASVRLTSEIRSVWNPDPGRVEADTLRVLADGQYLKVVVEDDLGVEIELDQRSEGFQWLVSFFVVFFAEAADNHANAILLLDEPGLSLHGLKQRGFRQTISRLASNNQTIYTTHSPFLVGPDELDLVRVVEMTDRDSGTKVHTDVTAGDPAALLPLQEALGYDLAQSLFTQQRNLVLEGLTDYWYLDATAQLLRDAGLAALNEKVALVPADSAGKVVYFATILHANRLKVAALLDSDNAGDNAARQDTLVHTLGNKNILRTADVCPGEVTRPEIEDLLRATLVHLAKNDLGWDIEAVAASQPSRPIVDIFVNEIADFSKYRLAKAYLRWTRDHVATDLKEDERGAWADLVSRINKALK